MPFRRIKIGDVIIAEAAVRDDGTTKEYINVGYPAVASFDIVEALKKAAREQGVRHHVGIVRTNDAFYGAANLESIVNKYKEAGVLSFDMECSAVFIAARLRGGMKAGGVLGVVNNVVKGESGMEEKGPLASEYKRKAEDAEKNAIKVAVRAVKLL